MGFGFLANNFPESFQAKFESKSVSVFKAVGDGACRGRDRDSDAIELMDFNASGEGFGDTVLTTSMGG